MPDFGAPVAQNVDINPLRTLGDILSLKQKQVGLQQQQQVLKSETAQAQQQTQTAGQRGALAGFYQHFDPTKHVGTDGTLDLDAVLTDPKIRQAAGDQFPEVMQQMIATKNGQLQTKQQLANLNGTLRDQFSSAVGSLRTDPDVVADNNVGRGKVLDAMQNFGETGGPDAQRIAQTYGSVIQHVPKGNLKGTLSNFQLQAMSAGEQAGRQAPNYAQVDTGATTEVRNVNPQAEGGNQMPGSFRNTVGPGAIPMNDARGAPFIVNPQSPNNPQPVGPGAQPGAAPAQNPNAFQAPTYPGQARDIEHYQGEVQGVRSAADQAPLNRNIYQTVLKLADNTTTGQFAAWAQKNPVVGQLFGDNYQELGKYLEKNAIANMTAMGGPPSDARLSAATAANGSTAFNPKALKAVTQFNYASNTGIEKYRQGIDHAVGTDNPNYKNLPTFKSAWTKNFDIDVFRLENAISDGDKKAQAEILSSISPAKARELMEKRKNLEALSATGKLP